MRSAVDGSEEVKAADGTHWPNNRQLYYNTLKAERSHSVRLNVGLFKDHLSGASLNEDHIQLLEQQESVGCSGTCVVNANFVTPKQQRC